MSSLSGRFPKRRAFVTGAGSGLGRALCLELAAEGFTIGVQDLRADRAEETLCEVVARGGRGRAFVFDVSDGAAFGQAADQFLEAEGGLDLLVNNAGVAIAAPLLEVSRDDWSWILAANLRGPIEGCLAFLPAMQKAGAGHVVNVASLAGLVPAGFMGPYSVTKYAVVALSETLRLELAGSGVGITLVCPSFFQTNIARDGRGQERLRGVAQWLMDLGGWTPERIARVVLRAVAKRRFYVLPQADAKAVWLLRRLSPKVFFWAAGKMHRMVLRRTKGATGP